MTQGRQQPLQAAENRTVVIEHQNRPGVHDPIVGTVFLSIVKTGIVVVNRSVVLGAAD
jgi:hypothetical protein